MSLAIFLADELEAQSQRWLRALRTLPARDLNEQRAELVRRTQAGVGGATPAALVLKAVETEIARRAEGRPG